MSLLKHLLPQRLVFVALVCISGACTSSVELPEEVQLALQQAPETIDYNLHVKPILSDRCFKCHGPDKSKIEANLQLASFAGATQENKEGRQAIVPGEIAKSELVRRILSHDPEEVMPTPKSNLTLTNEEKAILVKWIDQGAEYKEHWSLTKIKEPDVPKVGKSFLARWALVDDDETKWVRNEIDQFVLDKMKQLHLHPSPEAAKTTLLRRVYMDLTGLPPTPDETAAFLVDKSSDAYEKVVDKLLKSPHFGEQQAISWLDLARYADSHGYQDDGMRNAFPYRDWVINSFNKNLPFDKFVAYQLAGDLMPHPTKEMMVATSFNRQHPQSQEGGVIPEEYRTEYVADRANTFGKAFLGLTMECARCHDHKYDPILQKDYYSLFAFFNQNKEYGIVPYKGEASPTVMLPTREVEQKIHFIRTRLKPISAALQPQNYQKNFLDWLEKSVPNSTLNQGLLVYLPMEPSRRANETNNVYQNQAKTPFKAVLTGDADRKPLVQAGKIGSGLQFRGDCGLELYVDGVDIVDSLPQKPDKRFGKGLNFESNQPFSVSLWVNSLKRGSSGAIFKRSNLIDEGYRGYAVYLEADGTLRVLFSYVYPANCIEFRTKEKLPLRQWQHLTLTYDGRSKADGVRLFLNGKRTTNNLLTDNLTKSLLHELNGKTNLKLFTIGNDYRQKTIADFGMDEFRIYDRQLSALEVQSLTHLQDKVAAIRAIPADKRSPQQQALLLEHYTLTADTVFSSRKRQYIQLRGQEVALLTDIPEVMTMQELPANQARKTFILNRGVYDAPGEEVKAETPLKLGKLPEGYTRNRLGLATWLLNKENPLFARVMVNRLWQQYFGNGIVKTQEDFGNQGDLPSHPELLDWLANQFRQDGGSAHREGWDTKRFIRRMVLSATYRQSSKATKEEIERDPDNKWLARGSSYRYSAEQVRDNALAASGLLVKRVGGPSVYPYQPAGIWEALARNVSKYRQQHGDSLYRRSMYTIWKRTAPHPMMLNFDSPDRSTCTVRRQKTATPLQALVTLNDPQFVEAARVLAERTIKRIPTLDGRIAYFFQAAISRPPWPDELRLMKQLYRIEYKGFTDNKPRAESLLNTGEYARDKTMNPSELAAYTVVANTILNYDEAIVKR